MLIKKYTLGGHLYKAGISRIALVQLKISTITPAVFKLQYQYQWVFYEYMTFLYFLIYLVSEKVVALKV